MDRAIVSRCKRLFCAALLAGVLPGIAGCNSKPAAPAPAPAAAVSPDTWATVDGHAISRDQVEKEFRRLRQGSETLSVEEALVAKIGILEDMILEQLMLSKASSQGVTVAETELDTAFNEAKKDIPDAAFQQELARRNLTPADMRDGLRREMLGRKMMEHEVTAKVTVTDQEVTDYFNANRAQFNLPEEAYHLAQIVVTPRPDQQVGNRTGDDAVTPEAAANKVKSLMERLKAGGSFADLARDFSEDPNTAQRGGDLGLVPLSQIQKASPLLRDAALKTTPGSARVVNENGVLTIVFVVSREPKGQRELSTPGVKEQITAGLRSARQQALRAAYLAALRSDAKITNYLARKVVENQGRPPAQ
jgi:peptidyl-prolyl cis-trans isomerase SurA